MFDCMKWCGALKRSSIGGVSAATGARAARIFATDVPGCTGPTPDEPATVTCGGALRASFGSKRFWMS